MSRIGKLPVSIPAGVKVSVADNIVTVTGPKGTLTQNINGDIAVTVNGNEVVVTRHNNEIASRSYHGLYRQLISNMIIGVSQGFSKSLLINGVGYKADLSKNVLTLSLGYSTIIDYIIPEGIQAAVDGNKVTISGISKEQVGQEGYQVRNREYPPQGR